MKTQFDLDLEIIKNHITTFKGNQKTRFRQQIVEGEKTDNLAFKLFNVCRKLLLNNNNKVENNNDDDIIKLQNKIDDLNKQLHKSNKEIKDLNKELNETYTTIDNLDNEIIKLKEKYIIPKTKPEKIDNIPSVLDEPVFYDNNTNYDPYNTTYDSPIVVSDITSQDINNILTYNGISYNEWNSLHDIEKINYYNAYNNIDDGSISNMKLKAVKM